MGELEDRIEELGGRVRRLDGAMAELRRARQQGPPRSALFAEALRDFERDLKFVQGALARLRGAAAPPDDEHAS